MEITSDEPAGRDADPDAAEQRPATYGLISTEQLARHYGITPASVRRLMADHGISAVRGWPAEAALAIVRPGAHPAPGPGRPRRRTSHDQADPPEGQQSPG
jgi:hypothetical protein